MSTPEHRMQRKGELATCPFCQARIPRPRPLEPPGFPLTVDEGGRCGCGALYILDANGRSGGQALMDGLALLCNGDLQQAIALRADEDYRLVCLGYSPRSHTIETLRRGRTLGHPKLWFFQRPIAT